VPYKGSALAQQAVLAKEVDAAFDNPAAMGLIKGGRLRAIAVSSAQRWRDLPDVPTLAESGYAGFDISFWIGVLVPAATPASVHKTLVDAIRSAQDDPAARKLIEAQGNLQMLDPGAFKSRIKSETARWAEIIKSRNISLEQ
jgi:tripartite-type tricarboxylate transporter receptor subunit TctC